MSFKIDQNTYKELEELGKKEASKMADDAKNKMVDKYVSLISSYYDDYTPKKDKYGKPYYIRTFNLFNSYSPYKKNPHNTIYYGGIHIHAGKMYDYYNKYDEVFPADTLLEKFIYTTEPPYSTWHGGDWHGGYGVKNSFSIYEEIHKYRDKLIDYYTKECSVK